MKNKKAPGFAKKGLLRIIFSRTGIILLLILLQLGFFFVTTSYLQGYKEYIYNALKVLSVGVIIYIINDKSNPAFKMTWMVLVLVFPVIGTLFYLYAKMESSTRLAGRRVAEVKVETGKYMIQDQETLDAIWASRSSNANLAHFLSNQVGYPAYRNTQIKYFPLGEYKFKAMMAELQKAEKFIFLEYFIIEPGYMWNCILKVLKEKAEAGVEVRVMYDGMCAISAFPHDYPEKLRRYGINCRVANRVRPFLSTVQNNRDHRKICVIDGKVGFTGGVNIADEYINRKKRFGHWKDAAIMMKGDAVRSLTILFLQMWNVAEKGPEEDYSKYLNERIHGFKREYGYVIPYADNPFDGENVGEEVYFHILNHAKKYVHIMTPYLILDQQMMSTLTRVAKSGVEVVIIMPHIPDKWYAFALAKTYYRELIASGVQIYEYTPGFVHAKIFVSDDDTATVGTVNLDYRSLYLHFECGAFIYNNSEIDKIESDFQRTLSKSHKVTLLEVRRQTILTKLTGWVFRILAPLM